MLVVNGIGPRRAEILPRCSSSAVPQAELMAQRLSCAATLSHPIDTSPSTSSQSSPNFEQSFLSPISQIPHPLGTLNGRLFSKDDFDFLEVLGEGFFGTVQKVRQRSTGEIMVMKICKDREKRECRRTIEREAEVLERVAHEGILALRGICVDVHAGGWDAHLVVDYCEGGSLHRRILAKSEPLPWEFRIRVASEIAAAMAHVHRKRIVHRDLTSMNVLLRRQNGLERAVVADFGLSCNFPREGERLSQVGTTYFMSPECLNEEVYDEKTDVFSFGIILCQLIARIEADPDSGLHRTSSFGLNYILFTTYCPSDTPLDLLQLTFSSCLLNPRLRPSFDALERKLRQLRAKGSPSTESRLGRSQSDAALKMPERTPEKRVLVPRQSSSNIRPLREGKEECCVRTSAMEALALDAARGDGDVYDVDRLGDGNPFMDHARYRSQRKILPRRMSESRHDEVRRPDNFETHHLPLFPLRRTSSLPLSFEATKQNSQWQSSSRAASPTSPGRIPMAYRDFDQEFIVARKRSARRHTVMGETERGMSLPLSLALPSLPSATLFSDSVFLPDVVQEQPRYEDFPSSSTRSSWDVVLEKEKESQLLKRETFVHTASLACSSCERPRRKEQCQIL